MPSAFQCLIWNWTLEIWRGIFAAEKILWYCTATLAMHLARDSNKGKFWDWKLSARLLILWFVHIKNFYIGCCWMFMWFFDTICSVTVYLHPFPTQHMCSRQGGTFFTELQIWKWRAHTRSKVSHRSTQGLLIVAIRTFCTMRDSIKGFPVWGDMQKGICHRLQHSQVDLLCLNVHVFGASIEMQQDRACMCVYIDEVVFDLLNLL